MSGGQGFQVSVRLCLGLKSYPLWILFPSLDTSGPMQPNAKCLTCLLAQRHFPAKVAMT